MSPSKTQKPLSDFEPELPPCCRPSIGSVDETGISDARPRHSHLETFISSQPPIPTASGPRSTYAARKLRANGAETLSEFEKKKFVKHGIVYPAAPENLGPSQAYTSQATAFTFAGPSSSSMQTLDGVNGQYVDGKGQYSQTVFYSGPEALLTDLTPAAGLKKHPALVDCHICDQRVVTATRPRIGTQTHVAAALLLCFTCLVIAWIPYVAKGLQDVAHICPNCGGTIAIYHRSGRTIVPHQIMVISANDGIIAAAVGFSAPPPELA